MGDARIWSNIIDNITAVRRLIEAGRSDFIWPGYSGPRWEVPPVSNTNASTERGDAGDGETRPDSDKPSS